MTISIKSGFFIAAVLFLASCGDTAHQHDASCKDTANTATTEDLAQVPVIAPSIAEPDQALAAQVQSVYNLYLHTQIALAGDRPAEAAAAAARLGTLITDFKDSALPEAQRQAYTTHIAAIGESAVLIGNSRDIEKQRLAFEPQSTHVFELLKAFGNDRPVYQAHCPMAFDNKGANWLSDKAEIRNPYFGDQMLECGEVIAVIKK